MSIEQSFGNRAVCALLVVSVFQGCNVGPDYVPPEIDMPDAWHDELTKGLSDGEANLQTWWTVFEDPVLDSLIERAVAQNLDLHVAYERIAEARALRGIASGSKFPVVDGTGSYQRIRLNDQLTAVVPGVSRRNDFFSVGFDASWEIDVFGGIRRAVESADASLQASVENYRDLLVILLAEVALNYVQVRTLQERLRVARANVQAQTETLQLVRDRLAAELVPELDVRQAETNLATTESAIPTLQQALTQTVNRLGVLLGAWPSALHDELAPVAAIPNPPGAVAIGLPANLLRQRPDIRRAERNLAAQTAQIGVATADLYPRFSLIGSFTLDALEAGDLFDGRNRGYSFGPAFRWNIFDGGRIRNNIRAEDSRTRQALLRYEQTVLLAVEEVEGAMVAYEQEQDRREALQRAVTAAQASVELVRTLYRTGLTDFQNVLDSERSLFQQQDQLAESEGLVTTNLVQLYRALGGGWAPEPENPPGEGDSAAEPPPTGEGAAVDADADTGEAE